MSSQLSTQNLIDWFQKQFTLTWTGGKPPCNRKIQIPTDKLEQLSGFLNPIRWQAIHLLDDQTHTHLDTLSEDELTYLIYALKPNTGLGIINLVNQRYPRSFIKQNSFSIFNMQMPSSIGLDAFQKAVIELSSSKLSLHGNVVEIFGHGVLIIGKPGVGKSTLSLQLIKRGHCLVADDITDIYAGSANKIFARCPPNSVGIMHARERGFIDVARVYGVNRIRKKTKISAIILLTTPAQVSNNGEALMTPKKQSQRYFNVRIPEWELHSGVPGLANKIEAIAESLLLLKPSTNELVSLS